MVAIDLRELAARESEQVEWKENVASPDGVVATLSAFANDLPNLGGGYVVCGASETKDEHGFPKLLRVGLTATRLKEVVGMVLTRCRDRVSPAITPLVHELPADTDDRRVLVFVQPATPHAHMFRHADGNTLHHVRRGSSTEEARNGVLRELLTRKGALEPWDRRPCATATVADLDLLALRDTLLRIGRVDDGLGVEDLLGDGVRLHALVPSLCVTEALTGVRRPRNFAVLLFGRDPTRFFPGAVTFFSRYRGVDRSESTAERHELTGALVEQARRLLALLDAEVVRLFEKTDVDVPDVETYPRRALHEAAINALVHRDYELDDPTRVTAFVDRVETVSPGALLRGVSLEALREGRESPRWRNQSLAWFFLQLKLAQGEGQGVPTMRRTMADLGSPPPEFDADEARVTCVLRAHPRRSAVSRYVAAPSKRPRGPASSRRR